MNHARNLQFDSIFFTFEVLVALYRKTRLSNRLISFILVNFRSICAQYDLTLLTGVACSANFLGLVSCLTFWNGWYFHSKSSSKHSKNLSFEFSSVRTLIDKNEMWWVKYYLVFLTERNFSNISVCLYAADVYRLIGETRFINDEVG